MRKRLSVLAGVAVSASLAVGALAPIASAATTRQDIPLDGLVVTNPCNGENVALTGDLHMTSTFVITPSGNGEVNNHVNSQDVHGIGDQGNTYTSNLGESDQTLFTPSPDLHQALTGVTNLRFQSAGSAPNFEAHILFHLTSMADGTQTASVFNITTNCQG